MRVYLREFGMSPSSRARLKGSPKDEKATDEVFLFGRN